MAASHRKAEVRTLELRIAALGQEQTYQLYQEANVQRQAVRN